MAVVGGKLGFNTFMFSILCIVAFAIIAFNKCAIGPEAAVGLPRAGSSARLCVRSRCARFVSFPLIQRPASRWTMAQTALVNTLLISVTCAVSTRAPSATRFRPAFTSVSGSAMRALLYCSAVVEACSCMTAILRDAACRGWVALTHRAWDKQGGLHYRGCDQQPDQQFPQLYVALLSMETDGPLQRSLPHPWPCRAYFKPMHARRLRALAGCRRVVGNSGQVLAGRECRPL